MTKSQTKTATSAADVRKAGKDFLRTVMKDGLSAVRTDEGRYADLWADVKAYVDEDSAVKAEAAAEAEHATASAALDAARADEAEKRDALKVATTYRQAVEEMRRTVGLAMVDLGVTGRQTARILGVTEGAVRKWKRVRAAAEAAAEAAANGAEDGAADGAEDGADNGAEVTAPTPAEVRRALDAAADLLSGLDPVSSVKVLKSLESRVSKITGALADLQSRSAKGARNAA